MLLEGAIGDAYGMGFEYANENIKYNDLSGYVRHPKHSLYPGQYTDDTQMSIALAELVLSDLDWTPINIANKFVECFKRDWRDGYSRLFQAFLERIESGEQFLAEIKPDSDKSGGAMRASCIGLYPSVNTILDRTTTQCKLTHNTPDGIDAARASSLLSHFMAYELGRPEEAGKFINETLLGKTGHNWDEDYVGKVKSKGWMSVRAAITAIKRNSDLSSLLKDCINFTGDVDTVATIALSAASCSRYYDKNLPQKLYDTLENGKYGKDYLTELDNKLYNKFGFGK